MKLITHWGAVVLFFSFWLVAVIGGCRSSGAEKVLEVLALWGDFELRALTIATINLEGTPADIFKAALAEDPRLMTAQPSELRQALDAAAARRTKEVARSFKSQVNPWGIVGLQEVRYRHHQWSSTFHIGHIELSNVDFPCTDGSEGNAAHCFARELRNATSIADRALGVVSNDDFWEYIGGSKVKNWIGTERNDIIHRTVLGGRFKNKRSGKIVPVYSTHISNAADCHNGVCECDSTCRDRFFEEVSDLVATIRNWQRSGDLPPVLVGDFNCGGWDSAVRRELLAHFSKAEHVGGIDLVFVGRHESFPSSGERWVSVENSARRIEAGYPTYTDHRTTVVKLVTEPAPPVSDIATSGPLTLDPTAHCP